MSIQFVRILSIQYATVYKTSCLMRCKRGNGRQGSLCWVQAEHNARLSAWIAPAFISKLQWKTRRKQIQKNKESYSEARVCMCGVSTQQWPSTQITLFERKRQSAAAWPQLPLLDAVTTPVDKKRLNSCVIKHLFFWGSSATKKNRRKEPEMPSLTRC